MHQAWSKKTQITQMSNPATVIVGDLKKWCLGNLRSDSCSDISFTICLSFIYTEYELFKRISSVGTFHRHLYFPYHRYLPPHCNKSRILLGNQVLVDFPVVGNWWHRCLAVYWEYLDSFLAWCVRILIVLDHQRSLWAGRKGEERLVSQESQTDI